MKALFSKHSHYQSNWYRIMLFSFLLILTAIYSFVAAGCTNETFTAASGIVTDNSGSSNYGNNMTCSKLIQPSGGGIDCPYIHFIRY